APRPEYPGPFVQADATERLPFADGQFDLAYSSSVIEHVPREQRAAFAGALVPDRAARAAAVRALAAAGAAAALLAPRRPGPLGGHRAARPPRGRGAVRPGAQRARRPAHEELGLRA